MGMKRVLHAAIGVAIAVAAMPAAAWDGTATGKISQINGVGGLGGAPGNYDIRVYLAGQSTICPGAVDPTWGYINVSDPNYKGLLAMLLTAQASGKTVTLYTNKDSTGYCQIAYMAVMT
ncbi:hypothetical protein [Dyella mobilis]|uniref:Uncharacterized protein n=1 Tax=Dyella mobilis TaxID=1849582 RepID=A0ABS2KC78_9GAMM|nr:hypothetical protein [Dyella mobilis]MBM7128793.1 hypothetical protein [Dyella mobilis]GLQ99124.1 hypothetical protein GCM10007863_35440 [Dyella mobilis]